MTVEVCLLDPVDVHIWGLRPEERLERALGKRGDARYCARPESLDPAQPLLLIHGDWLLDQRALQAAMDAEPMILCAQDGRPVAVRCTAGALDTARAVLLGADGSDALSVPRVDTDSLNPGIARHLRKLEPPRAYNLREQARDEIEQALYDAAYKSVTDFVTKWLWPRPAYHVTRWLAGIGVKPNHVTAIGLLLVIAAGWLFARGEYGWGLAAGWLMTFLDTVDGKLARVTLTSSPVGNVFDHGVDLLHPPVWYALWAGGLGASAAAALPGSVPVLIWAVVAGYVLGRAAEGAFELMAPFSVFTWRPFDSFNRLITARRNPCLVLLTAAALAGRPDWGLLAVVAWTLASTALLWLRVVIAIASKWRTGELRSWLEQAATGEERPRLALRVFAGAG